ncbi:type I-E CRISPR-associated protein Cse2/CasB [Buchananella felis]|uniref:type I-E CRISPR-associated protein Cse2/CasB n=1 Tax=Buchananella felis TaxID=3231492 RepID=UPI0035274962
MTTLDPGNTAVTPGDPPPRKSRRPFGNKTVETASRVLEGERGLQRRYLEGESRARAELAQLRKAVPSSPGDVPAIWHLTSVEVPTGAGDEPTWEEIAVHTALTLYAVHQQSRSEPMHVRDQGLGHAARALVGTGTDENDSLRARFNALVTSSTITELRHHLKTFSSLLRAKGIPMDYVLLAGDLVRFQTPGGASAMRLTWAREFAALPPVQLSSSTTSPSSSNDLEH